MESWGTYIHTEIGSEVTLKDMVKIGQYLTTIHVSSANIFFIWNERKFGD